MFPPLRSLPVGAILALSSACAAPRAEQPSTATVARYTANAFTTRFELRLAGRDPRGLDAAAEACFAELERCASLTDAWREDSALARLNRAGALEVPGDLLELLAACRAACEQTGGAFDVTVGALLEAYGFYAEGEAAPDPAALAAARLRVGCDVLEFEPERARLRVPGARLDLGAVAKGWAVDRMVAVLKTHGIEHALVWAGGSAMRAFGHEPGQEGWTVQIPGAQDARSVVLHDEALATSGQLSTPFFVDGRLASHVLDPRVGRPVDHGTLVSVVVASDATRADIYSTALLVLGPEETEAWWPRQGPASGLSGALQIGVDPDVRERRVESSWGRPFTSP